MRDDTDFDSAIDKAWSDHANDPRSVAARLPHLQSLAAEEAQLLRVIALSHHVHGAHLGAWDEGASALEGVRTHRAYRDEGPAGQSLRRTLGSLALCAGRPRAGFDASDEIRVHAMAAENLCDFDAARAAGLLRRALELADASSLPASDPMHRAIAVAANNLASTLEERHEKRTADERTLMIQSAEAARLHWESAGGWLEVERAEYRLAMTWVQAGDAAKARAHAQMCLEIVAANGAPALEAFFGWEAMCTAERAAGDASGHALALQRARAAFDALEPGDQSWCKESLDKLTSPAPG